MSSAFFVVVAGSGDSLGINGNDVAQYLLSVPCSPRLSAFCCKMQCEPRTGLAVSFDSCLVVHDEDPSRILQNGHL